MASFVLVMNQFADMVGKFTLDRFYHLVAFARFQADLLRAVPYMFKNIGFTIEQMFIIGITSIPLVTVTAVFTGGVTAYQMAYQFADIVPQMYIGVAVGKSVLIELGPVLTAMVMAGRIGAAMCAELATMSVTEQLDAMKCLNINPFRYLLAPRLVASVIMLPVLNIVSSAVAIVGAWVVAYVFSDLSWSMYFKGVRLFYTHADVVVGLVKSTVFGYILAAFATYFGYNTTNGAEGVGESVKASVVSSMTAILIATSIVSKLLL